MSARRRAILLESTLFFRTILLRCLQVTQKLLGGWEPAVKCPKCGFVSYAGLTQCKKCGYQFGKAPTKGPSSSITSLFPGGVRSLSPPSSQAPPQPSQDSARPGPELPVFEAPLPAWAPASPPTESEPPADVSQVEESGHDWKEELSERVESFRKRRARLKHGADFAGNLELDFENSRGPNEPVFVDDASGSLEESGRHFDVDFGDSATPYPQGAPPLEGASMDRTDAGSMQLGTRAAPPEEVWLGGPAPGSEPMEIAVGSPGEVAEVEEAPEGMLPAPLSRRFLAGVTDALVLLLGAVLFGIIFWRSGGQMSSSSVNMAVLGVVAYIFVFAYFGLFTTLTSTTPGLLLMGYEIRNLHGAYPTPRESFWRAFGVLVSMSALMLGFVWAWVDSDSLTWHDRMSGTFITEAWTTHETSDLETQS
jgi:uncharacterized RDD family membrane protein YckC